MTHPIATAVFWLCAFWCVYVYALYPLLLAQACQWVQWRRDWRYFGRCRDRRLRDLPTAELPSVTLVIPVHNEAAALPAKVANLEALDYPPERLQVIFLSDGSSDASPILLAGLDSRYDVDIQPQCLGKARTLNRGVALARHELLVLCDAATLLEPDAVRKLVRHFVRPEVGVVCGALSFDATDESQRTEGLYWRYETVLRLMEARLGATLTASGALYALRRRCFRPLRADELLDDFELPMHARALGYTVEYDPEARAVDVAAATIEDEFARRVRLAVGSFRALGRMLRVPMPAAARWAFLSHKVGRWLLPPVLLALLGASIVLAGQHGYGVALGLQLAFYGLAGLGLLMRGRARQIRSAGLAYYLVAMNAAFLVGLWLLLFRHGETKWQRAQ